MAPYWTRTFDHHLEDLTDYRETAAKPIHDWPYAEIEEKIAYKAEEEGIPVVAVDPQDTSPTCQKCGETSPQSCGGDSFRRLDSGCEVHADVNAAMDIAQRGE